MKFSKCISVALVATILTGCSGQNVTPSNADIGTVLGAVGGGVLGSAIGGGNGQLLAVGVGAVAGGFAGNAIGKTYDKPDNQ